MAKYNITGKHAHNKWKPITNRWPVLLICFFLFGFLAKATWNAYLEKRQSDRAVKTAEVELQKLEERNAFIKEELNKLSSEAGREAKLREKFGVGRPGEQVAIIVEAETDQPAISLTDTLWWTKTKNFFKSLFER
jgi:cell division protein FtsB